MGVFIGVFIRLLCVSIGFRLLAQDSDWQALFGSEELFRPEFMLQRCVFGVLGFANVF